MSGETEQDVSGWTTDTLKEYLDRRLVDVERSIDVALISHEKHVMSQIDSINNTIDKDRDSYKQRFDAAQTAIDKSEQANEKRFECVSADTPILCADLVWRPAGKLKVGDELIALDENAPTRSGRRFRRSVVTANSLAMDNLFSVSTPVGVVRCNANHPWLVRDHEWKWVKTSDIKIGDEVAHPVDLWQTDISWESGWLAGMFDGEGCLSIGKSVGKLRVQLSLSQRESPTSNKIAKALLSRLGRESLSYRYEPGTSTTPNNTVPFFHFLIVRKPDIMKILGSTRPLRLLAKADGVWENKVIAGNNRWAIVTSVEAAGSGTIAQLSTSTKTYIAGGFAMHNSVNEFRKTLSDQTNSFLPRVEYQAHHNALVDRVTELNDRLNRSEGQTEKSDVTLGKVIAIVGISVTVLGFILSLIVLIANGKV